MGGIGGTVDQAGLETHLAKCPYLEVRQLHIRVDGGMIFITGKVRSYYMKQMAQEFVRYALTSGCEVVNEVSVVNVHRP